MCAENLTTSGVFTNANATSSTFTVTAAADPTVWDSGVTTTGLHFGPVVSSVFTLPNTFTFEPVIEFWEPEISKFLELFKSLPDLRKR